MANNRQDIDDVSPSSEQPSIGIVSGKSNFGAESDVALTNAENVASRIEVTKPSEHPSIPDNPKLHVGDVDHKDKNEAAKVDSNGIIPGNSDLARARTGHSSKKTRKKAKTRKALPTTHNNETGLDEGADGGTSDETDESNPVTEQQNTSFRPSTPSLVLPPPASGLGQSEGAVASILYDDIQSKGAVGGSGSDHQPSSQPFPLPSQRCREQLPLAILDLPNTFPPVPPSPPPASGLVQSEGAVAGSSNEDIQGKGAAGGNGSQQKSFPEHVLSPSLSRSQPPQPVPSHLPSTFPSVPPSPSPSPPRLPLVEGAHSEQASQQDILFTSDVLHLRPNIAICDEGSRSVDLERKAVDWTDGRDRPQEPDDASKDHAENEDANEDAVNGNIQPLNNRRSTCLNCRQRSADMTLICNCQVLCQECVVQVDQCPRCGADNVGAFRFDS
ncbi:uncharacterized protein [Littorina saxatilis]|uniref:Uncharacterized protein n=1 Tax=Littorina saxatilis TaxID=31220 RepID=A0AAN9BL48_9CAEN